MTVRHISDGFHKIASIDNGGLKFDKDEMEFSHPCFQRENPYLLEHIKRKIATTKQVPEDKAAIKPEIVNKVMSEVKVVRGRQDTLDSRFSAMKQENEALWREIAVLRQKHMKQQQIVNKLIQFLVTLVQPTRGGAGINSMNGVKRRFQLMINDVPESAKKRKSSQDSGPVIHELTEDLLDDCNYDYEAPIDSPTILSPLTQDGGDGEDLSSPTNFRVEKITGLIDHPDANVDADGDDEAAAAYEQDGEVSYVIDKLPDNYDWTATATDNTSAKANTPVKKEPVQEYVISYMKPAPQNKFKVETKTAAKPSIATKSQVPGTSLLNQPQQTKKRPQLLLKMNKPLRNDGKTIQSVIGPSKVVLAKKPTITATNVRKPVPQSDDMRKAAASKSYTNQSDFDGSDMPNDLFESPVNISRQQKIRRCESLTSIHFQDDNTVSPMLNSNVNVASGSYNATLSDDYTKKLIPTSSKNLAVAKYNKQDCDDLLLNTP